jgi:hypothetical protein
MNDPLRRSRSALRHPGALGGLDARLGASLVPRRRCGRSERSSPRRGTELEPRNGVSRLDSGPVVARLDAGERLMRPCLEANSDTAMAPDRRSGVRCRRWTLAGPNAAGDVGRGFRPRIARHHPLEPTPTPEEAVRGASAARARSGGRKVRRGRAGPWGHLQSRRLGGPTLTAEFVVGTNSPLTWECDVAAPARVTLGVTLGRTIPLRSSCSYRP